MGYILLLNFVFPHPEERSQRRAVHNSFILVVLLEQDDLLEFIAAVQSLDIQSTGEAANDVSRWPFRTECDSQMRLMAGLPSCYPPSGFTSWRFITQLHVCFFGLDQHFRFGGLYGCLRLYV